MSSLHQDRLLAEGSEPETGSASALVKARRPSCRPAAEKATSSVPTQRQGTAKRSGGTRTTSGSEATVAGDRGTAAAKAPGALAARAKAAGTATRKVASAKAATVKAATAKAASGKAVTARATTVKVATAAKAAAAAKVTARSATGRSAAPKAAAPKAAATEAAAPKGAAPKSATAKVTAPTAVPAAEEAAKAAPVATAPEPTRVRPTPHKRTAPAEQIPAQSSPATATTRSTPATDAPLADTTKRRSAGVLRRRPPSIARRPSLYLAAALVGAMAVGAITTDGPAAHATATMSHSVSVAEELGIEATPAEAITDTDAAELLGDLAASRSARDAEQAAAAAAQAEADRVAAEAAAEAARPKAVLPVEGGRLTSQYGARWGTVHAGIDLAAPMRTPEYAVMDGVVLEAGPASGFGLAVYIQHENGDVSVYGHMDSILVKAGQVVRAGDTIALLGNRGQSTGPHLHFEVHVGGLDGQKIDPLPWLREHGIAV